MSQLFPLANNSKPLIPGAGMILTETRSAIFVGASNSETLTSPLLDKLVGAWNFSEGGVALVGEDLSFLGTTAPTLAPLTGTNIPTAFDFATSFDGVEEGYLLTGINPPWGANSNFSLATWFKVKSWTGDIQVIASTFTQSGLAWQLHLTVGGELAFVQVYEGNDFGTGTVPATLSLDTWYLAIVKKTLDGGVFLILDGITYSLSASYNHLATYQTSSTLAIAKNLFNNKPGDIDVACVYWWNKELSYSEEEALYSGGAGLKLDFSLSEPNPIADLSSRIISSEETLGYLSDRVEALELINNPPPPIPEDYILPNIDILTQETRFSFTEVGELSGLLVEGTTNIYDLFFVVNGDYLPLTWTTTANGEEAVFSPPIPFSSISILEISAGGDAQEGVTVTLATLFPPDIPGDYVLGNLEVSSTALQFSFFEEGNISSLLVEGATDINDILFSIDGNLLSPAWTTTASGEEATFDPVLYVASTSVIEIVTGGSTQAGVTVTIGYVPLPPDLVLRVTALEDDLIPRVDALETNLIFEVGELDQRVALLENDLVADVGSLGLRVTDIEDNLIPRVTALEAIAVGLAGSITPPSNPAAGMLWKELDANNFLVEEWVRDSSNTKWISNKEYLAQNPPTSTTTSLSQRLANFIPIDQSFDLLLTKQSAMGLLNATNNSTNYWSLQVQRCSKTNTTTNLGSPMTTQSSLPSRYCLMTATLGIELDAVATDLAAFQVNFTSIGSPSSFFTVFTSVYFRKIRR